jgi:hypothetical protein
MGAESNVTQAAGSTGGLILPKYKQPATPNFKEYTIGDLGKNSGYKAVYGIDAQGNKQFVSMAPQQQSAWATGLQIGADVVNAGSALMGAYTGWKGLQLAEDQFDFSKAATNRDIANQSKIINNEYANRNEVGLALGGGAMTADQIAASKANVAKKYVDGSAIG